MDSISLEKRTASSTFPTPPSTSSLSKAITIAAGATFTPSTAYIRCAHCSPPGSTSLKFNIYHHSYDRGSGACNEQTEGGDSDAVFLLEEGATLSHVVIGANQAEGTHVIPSIIYL